MNDGAPPDVAVIPAARVTNWLSMDYFSTKALAAFPANAFGNQLGAFDCVVTINRGLQFNSAIQLGQ